MSKETAKLKRKLQACNSCFRFAVSSFCRTCEQFLHERILAKMLYTAAPPVAFGTSGLPTSAASLFPPLELAVEVPCTSFR